MIVVFLFSFRLSGQPRTSNFKELLIDVKVECDISIISIMNYDPFMKTVDQSSFA